MDELTTEELKGRRKIYTDVAEITKKNVIQVLSKAIPYHEQNKADISYLLNFEKGIQPLIREKVVREEIDIESISNLASEITEFKLGYFWGNPIALVQKSDKNPKGSDAKTDNSAISLLNEMYDAEDKDSKDQELARYIEICGIGYQMIDIKRNVDDGNSVFDLITLNPLYTFIVYSSDVYHKPILGVTYVTKEDGTSLYTCISKDSVYIIENMYQIINGAKTSKLDYDFGNRSGEANPLGEVSIIEFERSYDRMGCFERQISELNALNVLESDLVNDVAQNTQAIWWGNDIKLEEDPTTGEPVGVKGGQWILSQTTGQNNKPDIKPLVLQYDYAGVLENIQTKHDYILERAFVPKQSDPGGGSTTGAMSLSSGWSACEAVAGKEALIVKKSFQERNRLALKAIKKSPDTISGSPLLTLSANDVEIRFIRQKTFDMATKVNSMSTMIQNFVHPRVAMESVDFFPNLAEAVNESVDMMLEYQKGLLKSQTQPQSDTQTSDIEPPKRIMADLSDQTQNSAISDL